MASEGLLFSAVLQAARPELLSVRTMYSMAWHQEGLWKGHVRPPEKS